jgi:hypothetical protein
VQRGQLTRRGHFEHRADAVGPATVSCPV